MFPLCTRKIEKRSLAGRKNMLWLKGWSIIIFMQQKNILSERSILKAFWDSKHGIVACFKRFYTVEEPVPVRCRSAFRNCLLLTNSSIFQDPSFVAERFFNFQNFKKYKKVALQYKRFEGDPKKLLAFASPFSTFQKWV